MEASNSYWIREDEKDVTNVEIDVNIKSMN